MKTITTIFATVFLFITTTPALAQISCNDYGAGGISCTGPDGYGMTQHNYSSGSSVASDNRGNSASINRYESGAVSITAPTGVVPYGAVPSQPYQNQMYPDVYPR